MSSAIYSDATVTGPTLESNTTVVPVRNSFHLSNAYLITKYVVFFNEAFLVVAGNIFTLIAVKRTKKLHQVPANTYIVSLAIADGMIGLLLPGTLLSSRTSSQTIWITLACLVRGPYYGAFSASLFTLLAIALDRYAAVIHPLNYKMRMTTNIALIVCVFIWIMQFVLWESITCYYGSLINVSKYIPAAAQDIFPKKVVFLLTQIEILLPIAGNVVLYIFIYIKLRSRRAVIFASSGNNQTATSECRSSAKARTFTKMMAFVLGYLILAWLPYYIIAPIHKVNDPSTPAWFVYLYDVVAFLFHSNSLINPIIYNWQNRDFRDAYAKILGCRRRAAPTGNSTSVSNRTQIVHSSSL